MENQHRQIKGYRELSQQEIDTMNLVNGKAQEVAELLDEINSLILVDARWLAIGKTHLQQGFMAVTRSITKPDFF